MFKMIIILFLYIIFVLGSLFTLVFPEYYFSELILSFLPYSIGISFLWLVWFSLLLKRKKSTYTSFKKNVLAFLILWLAVVFFIYSKKFTYFYHLSIPQIHQNMTWWIRVFYANIHKNNTDYTNMQRLIEKQNPDVLLLVEFADHHYTHLKDFLDKQYPYSNSSRWWKKYVGNMVFSKIPIENRVDDFPQWAWRYAYFSLSYQKKPIYFYLVHMSSPVSSKFYTMRNQQIQTFFKDFSLHQDTHRIQQDKVLALWDFNISPWSNFYWKFAEWFTKGKWFVNVTRSLPIAFTWRNLVFPFIWSHIDHIFINSYIQISQFSILSIPWSDHHWFFFIIK